MEGLRGIGRMARESGLSVSALRFYDGVGVLDPAHVDPRTGYRWYSPDQLTAARLLAVLRRVGMPLPEIREVLAHRGDPAVVDTLVKGHLDRLERDLDDARRELSTVGDLLFPEENAMSTTVVVPAAALAAALGTVRFAVDPDPAPGTDVLGGVLLDVSATTVTVVASDRYRLAVASAPVHDLRGAPTSAVLPATLADELAALDRGDVEIVVDGIAVTARCGNAVVEGTALDWPFPDYAAILGALPSDGRRVVTTTADELRRDSAAADVRTMTRETDGRTIEVVSLTPGGTEVGVDRALLLEAVSGAGDVRLEFGDPLSPITIRPAGVDGFSLLMPVKL